MNTSLLRRLATAAAVLGTLPFTARAQQDLLTIQGNSRGNVFGYSVANAGDANNDGFDDILVGIPFDNATAGINSGRVRIYSGKDGTLLRTVNGLAAGDEFGYSVASVGDVDGDGSDDFIAGSPFSDVNGTSSGQARVISGATGGTISTIDGLAAGDRLGWSVGYAGSIAGARRVVVGAPYAAGGGTDRGSASIYFASGGLLHTFNGSQTNEHCGYSVSGGFDTNGDGTPDVVVGSPDFDDGGDDTGRVRVFSAGGAYGTLQTQPGAGPGHHFGHAVAMLGDVNNDGDADYIVGAPDFVSGQGAAYVHSGSNGAILYTKTGGAGDHFGTSVAAAGDPNNDGRADFIVGAPDDTNSGPSGSAVVFSGLNGAALHVFSSTLAGGQYGLAVGGGGDVNADGREDLIVAAPYADVVGTDAGNVKVYTGNGYGQLWSLDGAVTGDALGTSVAGIGDINGDGYADVLVGSPNDDHTILILPPFSTTEEDAGSVKAISGKTGAVLWTHWGAGPGDELGFSVASLGGDVNGDGVKDLIVGAPQRKTVGGLGYAEIVSGATGATLFTVSGTLFDAEFGYAVAAGGKLTADSIPDAVVGAPGYSTDRGRVVFVNGATGALFSHADCFGLVAGERFGSAICSIGDQNADGLDDVLVGAPSSDTAGANAGKVTGIRGGTVTFGPLFTLTGTSAGDALGTSVCSVNSWDGDNRREFVVGAPGVDIPGFAGVGSVRSYFAATLTPYWTIFGTAANDQLGTSLANIGDFNLDGFDDVIAGATETSLIFSGTGYVKIISGYYGWELYKLNGASGGDSFGKSVAAAGDFNADGSLDIVVGAPGADPSGTGSGIAKVMSIHPVGISDFGSGSPGCAGPHQLRANSPAKIGNSFFTLSSNNVPAGNALGLLLLANVQDVGGSDPLALGVLFHVDLFASTLLQGYDMFSTQFPNGFTILPIPNSPPIVGVTLYAQSLWVNGCPLPPFNLSSSEGLAFTFQN